MTPSVLCGRLIRAAFGQLEPGNEKHWTSAGVPAVDALEDLKGLASISAAERDGLWKVHQEAQPS